MLKLINNNNKMNNNNNFGLVDSPAPNIDINQMNKELEEGLKFPIDPDENFIPQFTEELNIIVHLLFLILQNN